MRAGVPSEQVYIPCFEGRTCYTFTVPAEPLSVIAGHFTHAELERTGIAQGMDCMVNTLDPLPILCLPCCRSWLQR